jgi:arginyl-tRNA--protein-N-Asp/Glu arginylyltransferase
MPKYNLNQLSTIEETYDHGLLPQRNEPGKFYQDTSGRCRLDNVLLSSENRRIIRKTEKFTYRTIPLSEFEYNLNVQKQIFRWLKILGWDFPISSVKKIFKSHIFNQLDIWYDGQEVVAYSVSLCTNSISHIAYVFYNPEYSHGDLPIRLVLQFIIDSATKNLQYAYVGRFSKDTGYYKRNLPGFEYFEDNHWIKYQK